MQLECPRHLDSPHLIPLQQLELLEQVEGSFDTRVQTVEEVKCNIATTLEDPALSVLGNRLSCQEVKMASLSAIRVLIRTRRSARAFRTTMAASQNVGGFWKPLMLYGLAFSPEVAGPIGGEGWSALVEGIQSHPGVVRSFAAPKEALEEMEAMTRSKKSNNHVSG